VTTYDDTTGLLLGVPLLRDLTPAAATALVAEARVVDVRAGQALFTAGDEGAAMLVVLSGRLHARDTSGRLLRTLVRGDIVGELALLTGAPRSATVTATRDVRALEVPRTAFLELMTHDPRLARAVVVRLAEELSLPEPAAGRGLGVIAVVHLDQACPEVEQALQDELPGLPVLHGKGAPHTWAADLERAERHELGAVLECPADASDSWHEFCVRTADRVLLVGGGPSARALPGADTLALQLRPGECWPQWASELRPVRRHRLDGSAGASAALARRLARTSTGIVLSGGGARGMAHIGVIAALEEAGRRPERWGGCSMGAFVGALAAMGLDAERIATVARTELVQRHPFRDLTVPRYALVRARRGRQMLERVFGERRIEDLAEDFFCVTADLCTGDLVIHRDGLVSELVAASMAVPGLTPPLRRGQQVLVDGGVLDNLPVDVMRAVDEGPVVAVDVMRRTAMGTTAGLPSLLDTMCQALTIGGRQRLLENLERADVVITPDLGSTGLLDFDAFDRCVAAGRAAVG
jgi:NTE family protein